MTGNDSGPPDGDEKPTPDEFVELRKAKRVAVGVKIEYWVINRKFEGEMVDISLGGARINASVATTHVETGQNVRLLFSLFKTSTPVEISARVVHVLEQNVFAVEFKSMSPHVRSALRMAINRIATQASVETPDALMSRHDRE